MPALNRRHQTCQYEARLTTLAFTLMIRSLLGCWSQYLLHRGGRCFGPQSKHLLILGTSIPIAILLCDRNTEASAGWILCNSGGQVALVTSFLHKISGANPCWSQAFLLTFLTSRVSNIWQQRPISDLVHPVEQCWASRKIHLQHENKAFIFVQWR